MENVKEYVVRLGTSEGWAIFLLNLDRGYFSVVSDHGNYAYLWPHPGGEFRKFLAQCSTDYVYSKLTYVQSVFDTEGFVEAARAGLKEIEDAMTRPQDWIDRERDDLDPINGEGDFNSWLGQTEMENAYEYYRTTKEPHCWRFVRKLFTRFQEMLREELEKEKVDGNAKEEVSPSKAGT